MTVPHGMGWDNHQLIRLRLLLASIAELLGTLETACSKLDLTPADYGRFFGPAWASHTYSFRGLNNLKGDSQGYYTQAGLAFGVFRRLRRLARLIRKTNQTRPLTRLDRNAPRPTPELKTRPRV